METTQQAAEDASKYMSDKAQEAKEFVHEKTATTPAESASKVLNDAKDTTSRAAEDAAKYMGDKAQEAKDFVHEKTN